MYTCTHLTVAGLHAAYIYIYIQFRSDDVDDKELAKRTSSDAAVNRHSLKSMSDERHERNGSSNSELPMQYVLNDRMTEY